MARILLIGGHGKVALLLEPLLQTAGHHVTAVIREAAQAPDVASAGATPLVIDIEQLDLDQTTNLVAGNDIVIWSAGAGGGDQKAIETSLSTFFPRPADIDQYRAQKRTNTGQDVLRGNNELK